MLSVTPTRLPDVKVIQPDRFEDDRGFFTETWNHRDLQHLGIDVNFVQDNHSVSVQCGTVRGLHFQMHPYAQDKLVRCTRGALFDVAVDIRPSSSQFGQWVGVELTAEAGNQLFIPKGFAHGFMTLHPKTEVAYKCSAYYAPHYDRSIRWDDPDINITWPLSSPVQTSHKDRNAPFLRDL